jgi:two-component system OmpR family response regulator
MTQRILIVDDDLDIRSLLAENLTEHRYEVSTAADGVQMKAMLAAHSVDLIVMDINLPGDDGFTLCRELRKDSSLPVIMLTAHGDLIDRVLGLEVGADDYLPKPFEMRELLARIRAVLRRSPQRDGPPAKRAKFRRFILEFEQRQLIDPGGRIIMLSGTEYRLLKLFVDNPGRPLTRDELMESVLPRTRIPDGVSRAIDLQVSRMRQKLAEADPGADFIRTVRGEGYVFAAPVTLE